MDNRVGRTIAFIVLVVWLAVAGVYAAAEIIWVEDRLDGAKLFTARLSYVLYYLLLGIGPVLGFIIWMKRRGHPIGLAVLVSLTFLAGYPIAIFLAFVL